MRSSQLFLILSLVGTAALQLNAQSASPELQGKALELLRQSLSQDRQPGAEQVYVTVKPAATDLQKTAVKKPQETSAGAAAVEPGLATSPSTLVKQKSSSSSQAAKKTGPSVKSSEPAVSPIPRPEPVPAPAAPERPAGPKTKQQRLLDLAEEYKADHITPAEYQARRAKILAEP